MDLVIADFVDNVRNTSTDSLCFSIPHMPLSLRVILKGSHNDDDELDEDEKLKIPLISQIIAASKSRASIEVSYPKYPKVTLGSEDYITMFNGFQSEVNISILLRYGNHKSGQLMNLMRFEGISTDGTKHKHCRSTLYEPPQTRFNSLLKMRITILAHFPEGMVSREVPPTGKILEDGLFSDVTIMASNGAEIKAHKSFLSVHSPVLTATFTNDMQESQTGRLDMTDVSEQGIWAFLRYLYYGDLKGPKEDVEIAFQVMHAAHKYHVRKLEHKAIKCLMKRENDDFSVDITFKIYMFVRNVESESAAKLKAKAIQILIAKIDELEELQEYKDLFEKPSNSKIAMQVFKEFAKTKPLPQ